MKLNLLLLFLLLTFSAQAQNNPKPGYIITSQGDSIFGTVDYRTPKYNTQECAFMADDATAYTTYRPADIRGYGLTGQGNRLIARSVTVGGQTKTLFVEYIVDGVMSLYHFVDGNDERYLFENEEGQSYYYNPDDFSKSSETSNYARREELKQLTTLFQKSHQAVAAIKPSPDDWTELITWVKLYNDDVCGEDTCTIYLFDQKKNRLKIRYHAIVGAVWEEQTYSYMIETDLSGYPQTVTHGRWSPVIGAGIEILRPDIHKYFAFEASAALVPYKEREYDYKAKELQDHQRFTGMVSVGVQDALDLGGPILPMVRCGVEFFHTPNLYVGIGTLINVGDHAITLTCNYRPTTKLPLFEYDKILDVSLSYRF